MCTQTIVDTKLKESEPSCNSPRRSRRTITPEFTAKLVTSTGKHGVDANVLHRRLKELDLPRFCRPIGHRTETLFTCISKSRQACIN